MSGSRTLKIDGIASSQAIDTSAESIDIEGLDISSLEAGEGTFLYEHRHPKDEGASALDVLGAVTFAKKIMSESDCANDRERSYWNQVEMPFIYIQGELFNDEEDDHVAAQAMAAAIQFYKRKKLPIIVRFSIDGHTLERDSKNQSVLKRSIARDVAMTFKPANHSCKSDVMASKAELEKRHNGDDPEFYKTNGQYRFPSITFEMLPDEEGPIELIKSELELLHKAMTAGNPNMAPDSLTGGAALQASDVRLFTNRVKGALRDWNGRTNLKEHIKKSVPDASDSFLEKFSDLVDTLHLRKAMELHEHLESVMKGQQLEHAIAKLPTFPVDSMKEPNNSDNETKNIKVGANPGNTIDAVKQKHLTGMANEGLHPQQSPGGWSVNFKNQQINPDLKATNPVAAGMKPGAAPMQAMVSKLFPLKQSPIKSPGENANQIAQVQQTHMSRMANEGWNTVKDPSGNWTATPPLVKKGEAPILATINGQHIEPTMVQTPFFDDLGGKLYSPYGAFPVHIPSRDPVSKQAMDTALANPALNAFHDRAMAGWQMLNTALREGTLPDSIVKIASWLMQKQLDVPDALKQWMGSMAQLNIGHQFNEGSFHALKAVVAQHRACGKDALQAMANGGQLALSDRNARIGLNALGAGDVSFQDEHLIRSLFGLDHGKDADTIDVLKDTASQSNIWSDLEKYFADYHDAMQNVNSGPMKDHLIKNPKDALLPAVLKHWLAIEGHERGMGKSPAAGFQPQVDNPHTNLVKTEALTDVLPYVNVLNSWLAKYGPVMMLMMYFSMLVPKILAQNTPLAAPDPNGGLK